MKRRDFLKFTAGLSVGGAFGTVLWGCEAPSDSSMLDLASPVTLRVPQTLTSSSLTAAYGSAEVWPGSSTNIATLNGGYLGPTILRQRGEQVNLAFSNLLGEPSIIHWHGLNIPPDMDGHPMDAVQSGASFNYSFTVKERAGTYWYHAHPDMFTAKQTYMGIAGLVIVQDPEEQALALPQGEFDVPLIIQDKRASADGELPYNPTQDDIISGFLGSTVFVNGTPNAYLDVKSGLYRLRMLNASNARIYRLAFKDGRKFNIIATDGGLLDRPYEVSEAMLSPGERIEVLIEFQDKLVGSTVILESKEFTVSGSHGGTSSHQGELLKVITFNVRSKGDQTLTVPGSLVSLERLNEAAAVRERVFQLTMDHSRSKGIHMIDGKVFDMERSDYQIPFGELEVWEIQNQAEGMHSMHIHGAHFQVLERRFAGQMTPVDYGWKDTVLVNDNEVVRLAVRFDSFKGRYLFHCHFLEHEDDGMMVNIDVV